MIPSNTTQPALADPILPRIAAGDGSAVEECMKRYGALVWSVTRKFLSHPDDIEDATQEIFADLWSSAARFNPQAASEKTWVMMVARRRLIDRKRYEVRRPRPEILDNEVTGGSAELQADEREELVLARKALMTLQPDQRKVLELILTEGHSHNAVAKILKMPLGTVKTHARRGLLLVRERLGVTAATAPTAVGGQPS